MSVKLELSRKKELALLYTIKINDIEPNEKVKVKEIFESIPINGLDLLKYCAFCGAMIDNAEEVNIEDSYFLEFIGCGTYKAIKSEDNKLVKINSDTAMRKICAGENVYRKVADHYKLVSGGYDISNVADWFCYSEWYAESI